MSSFKYSAMIIETDPVNKVMTVVYKSEGRRDIRCGVSLPESEDMVGQAIHDAVPFRVWQDDERSVYVPQIGTVVEGTANLPPAAPDAELSAIPYSAPLNRAPHPGLTEGGQPLDAAVRHGAGAFPENYRPSGGPADPEVVL